MDPADALVRAGFTRQEAVLYLVLLRHGPLTGYEAAKHAGISRSNAYAALASLADKGGSAVAEGDPPRHVPTPPAELAARLRRQWLALAEYLERELPRPAAPQPPFLTISGAENVAARMRALVAGARERVYVSANTPELALVREELAAAAAAGRKVVLVTDSDPGIAGTLVHLLPRAPRQVKLIADTRVVLLGTAGSGPDSQALLTESPHLVRLMREALLNEIELTRLTGRPTEHSE